MTKPQLVVVIVSCLAVEVHATPLPQADAFERLVQEGKHREALAAVQRERTATAKRRNLRSLEEDRSLAHREATCRERLGQYRPALQLEKECLSRALAERDRRAVRRSLQSIADIQSYQGRYREALSTLELLLGDTRSVSAPRDVAHARAQLTLATALGASGRFAQQKRVLDAVVPFFERTGDAAGVVAAWSVLASYDQSTGRFEDGLAVADRALARARQDGKVDLVPLLVIRSGLLASLGRYEEALAQDRRATEIARAADLPKQVAACAGSEGASLFCLGDVRGAERSFTAALELNRRIGADDEVARQLYNLGRVAMAQLDPARARDLFEGALALQEQTGQDVARALTLSAQGEVATLLANQPEALELHRRALELYRVLQERTGVALENAFLAICHAELGDAGEALAAADRAGGVDDPEVRWRAELARGLAHRRGGRLSEAILAFERARSVLESVRAGVRARELRTTFGSLEERARVYEELLSARLAAGDLDGAFRVAEGYRARSLKELMADRGVQLAREVGLADVQRVLPQRTRVVAYFSARDELVAFVIERTRARAVRMPVPDARLRDLVGALRLDVAQVADVRPSARRLHQEVFEPLGIAPDRGSTVIIPGGVLHYVPFAALIDRRGRYLVEDHVLSYLPSAGTLLAPLRAPPPVGAPFVVFANPAQPDAARALPFAQAEGAAIAGGTGARSYTGAAATGQRFLEEVKTAGRVHLACHGELDTYRPLESALELAPEAGSDGRVRVGDLLGVRICADLVTLSACQTGLGQLLRGDEVVGLARAFLGAGAGAVMASLWSVADASTKDLMVSFYRALPRAPADRALRGAQLEMLRTKAWAHPFHWAAFTVNGGRPLPEARLKP